MLEATLGGTRKHVTDLLLHLPRDQFEITFIYSTRRADPTFFNDLNIIKQSGIHCVELPMSNSIVDAANFLCIFRLLKVLKRRRIEVLHVHGAIAGTIGRLAAIWCRSVARIIYSPHGGVLHKLNKAGIGWVFRFIEKRMIYSSLRFIAVSNEERQRIIKCLNVDPEKIFLIPNGISLVRSVYDKQELRRGFSFGENEFIVLYPALFLEAKGHFSFFSTLLSMPGCGLRSNIKIVLAGDGPLRKVVEEMVSASVYKGQILFAGFVKNVEEYFAASDLVILPSQQEAFGYVLLEALLHNKPVLATRVGGIPDIIEDRINGFLYSPDELDKLIGDINKISTDRNVLQELIVNIPTTLEEKFDVSKNTKTVASLYR